MFERGDKPGSKPSEKLKVEEKQQSCRNLNEVCKFILYRCDYLQQWVFQSEFNVKTFVHLVVGGYIFTTPSWQRL